MHRDELVSAILKLLELANLRQLRLIYRIIKSILK